MKHAMRSGGWKATGTPLPPRTRSPSPDHLGVAADAGALVASHRVPLAGRGQPGQSVKALLVVVVGVRWRTPHS